MVGLRWGVVHLSRGEGQCHGQMYVLRLALLPRGRQSGDKQTREGPARRWRERSRWTQDGCIDGNLMEVWMWERGVGAGSRMLPRLMTSAAGWVKKVDRRSTIGGFGAIEPGDQEQLELLAYQTVEPKRI